MTAHLTRDILRFGSCHEPYRGVEGEVIDRIGRVQLLFESRSPLSRALSQPTSYGDDSPYTLGDSNLI